MRIEDEQRKRRRRALLTALAVAVLAGGGWWLRGHAARQVSVATEILAAGPAAEVLAVVGNLRAGRTDRLGAPVLGQVVEVQVEEGERVSKGQTLVRLDDTLARQAVNQAQAALDAARVNEQAKARALDRAKALTDAISRKALEDAEFAWRGAAARVSQSEAALAQARQQLSLYNVTSPSDGTVLSVDVEVGQVVGSASVLVTVGDLDHPQAEVEVDEAYGVRLRPGLEARISPVGAEVTMPAHVDFVAPRVDPLTGGRRIRLVLDGTAPMQLPAGLTVSVNIVVEQFDAAITVPRSAILGFDTQPHVIVVEDGRARRRDITLRDWPSARLIVSEGLNPGEIIVLEPQSILAGQPVAGKD